MKKNNQHIDEIRFLIIHLILVNHSMLSYALIRDRVDQTLIGFWFEITSPILALMSGYLFFSGTANHFGYLEKVKRRVPSLVVPYVIWSLGFFVIYFLVKELMSTVFHFNIWYSSVRPLNLANALDSLVHPPLINFWYLQNLILIIPFNVLFYYLLKNRVVSLLFFALIVLIFAYRPFSIYFEPRFLPFYLMGSYFGYHGLRVPKLRFPFPIPRQQSNALVSTCFVPLTLFISVEIGFWEYDGLLSILTKIAVVMFLIISIYNLLDAYPDSLVFRYLKKYKPYSFFLFAAHTFIFSAVQRPLFVLAGNRLENKYFTLGFSLLTTALVLVVTLALGIVIKKRLPRFFGVITGR